MKKFTIYLLLSLFSVQVSIAQEMRNNPTVMAQVRAILGQKGISEQELKDRLKTKGINVDAMPEADIIKNRATIEQTVAELEAEKSQGKDLTPFRVSADTSAPQKVMRIDAKPVGSVVEDKSDSLARNDQYYAMLQEIYGHSIFRNNTLAAYRISKDASPPDAYILAPGDRINVLIFGRSQADLQYEINAGGYIQPAQMPKIFLSGLTLVQAREMLAQRFSTYYVFSKDQFALTLNTSRTLNINIFGEVLKAGSYTTSALNTALNALSVSGGPTGFGSIRNVQIIRGNDKKVLDVYAFMRNPILQFDFFLQNNDIIYVPPVEKIVTVDTGGVNRPMRYELKAGEGIKELVDFAGGLRADVYTEFVQVQRFESNEVVLKDYRLSEVLSGNLPVELRNGDIVRFRSITTPLRRYVKVTGAVEYEGSYELSANATVGVVLERARVRPEARIDQAFIIRKLPDNTEQVISFSPADIRAGRKPDISLQKEDEVLVYEQARFTDRFKISVVGEVRNPFERNFRYDETISVEEAVGLAGGLRNTALASGYIYRTNPFRLKRTEYIPVELVGNTRLRLQPGDQLVVLNKDDYEKDATLDISGEVMSPKQLRFDSTISFSDLVRIGGGTTEAADLNRVDVFRLQFSPSAPPRKTMTSIAIDRKGQPTGPNADITLQPYDFIVVRRIPEFELNESVEITGEVRSVGDYVMDDRTYHFSKLLEKAGGFTAHADPYNISLLRVVDSSGLVVFDANKALRNKGNKAYDPILRIGDSIHVPRINNVVQIDSTGTRYELGPNQRYLQVSYQGRKSAGWYIRNSAGGFAKRADRNTVKTIRENGIIDRTSRVLFFRNYPPVMYGDRITLSMKAEKKKKDEGKPVDWDKVFTRILAMGSTLAIILTVTK